MKKIIKVSLYLLFSIYCLALIKVFFLDGRTRTDNTVSFYFSQSNFLPFKTIYDYVIKWNSNQINSNIVIKNVVGNLIVLFPMGCFLPCLFPKFRKFRSTLVFCCGIVFVIEFLQPFFRVGFFDVDDILLNLIGAIGGALIVQIPFINKLLRKTGIYVDHIK